MALLKGTKRYVNEYEQAYDYYSLNNPLFNDADWRSIVLGKDSTDLNMYVEAMKRTEGINFEQFNKDYLNDYSNSDTRLAALYNEAFGDTETMREIEEQYVEDGVTKTRKVQISDYEYNKRLINQQNNYNYQIHLQELEEERLRKQKEDLSGWEIFWNDAGSLLGEFLLGMDQAFTSLAAFLWSTGLAIMDYPMAALTLGDSWGTGANGNYGKGFVSWDDYFSDNYGTGYTFGNAPTNLVEQIVGAARGEDIEDDLSLRDSLTKFETEFTNLRDLDGELTTGGEIFVGAAQTAGEMMALQGVGAGISHIVGATGKLATVISTATYYTPLGARSMHETMQQFKANGISYNTGTVFANQLVKTSFQIALEVLLGKGFGKFFKVGSRRTGLDKWLFNMSDDVGKIGAKSFGRILADKGLDILQEAGEEVLQEMSDVAVDNLFGAWIDSGYADLSELTGEDLANAAIIAAIVSGGHSALDVTTGILSSKSKDIKMPDGSTKHIGKLKSYVESVNMTEYVKNVNEALANINVSLKDLTYTPSKERLTNYQQKKEVLLTQRASLVRQLDEMKSAGIGKTNKSGELVTPPAKIDTNREQKLLSEISKLDDAINAIDKEISNVASQVESPDYNDEVANSINRDIDETRTTLNKSFTQLYASMRMLESVTKRIGPEKLEAAEKILTSITEHLKEDDFDPVKISLASIAFQEAMELEREEVSTSLRDKIKKNGIRGLLSIFHRKKDEPQQTFQDDGLTKEESKKMDDFTRELYKKYEQSRSVIFAEKGKNPVENDDGSLIIVPVNQVEHGVDDLFENLAEQRLVETIAQGEFKGEVLERITEAYRKISGDEEAFVEDALYNLLFDKSFFLCMLMGDESKGISMADVTMYQFLSSLRTMEEAIVPKDLRDEVYKKKIKTVKTNWTRSLVAYAMIQPYAEYDLDYFSKEHKDIIRKIRESRDVANRFLEGKPTKTDITFMDSKLNSTVFTTMEKNKLRSDLFSDKPQKVRNALIKIDEAYYTAFYSYFDGKHYMPVNSRKNQAFNRFLFNNGADISTITEVNEDVKKFIEENYGEFNIPNLVSFLSLSLSSQTNKRYTLEISQGGKPNGMNGSFEIVTQLSNDGGRFVGTSGMRYNEVQSELLSNLSVIALQNAADLYGKRDILFRDLGISDQKVIDEWIAAGLTKTATNDEGKEYVYIPEAILGDERDRRRQKRSQDSYIVTIVDNVAPSGYKRLGEQGFKRIAKEVDRTYITASGRHTKLVNAILNTEAKETGAGYYTIDDVITDPSLLSNTLQKKIKDEYEDLTSETAFAYLKHYFADKKWNLTLTLDQEGTVRFANVDNILSMFKSGDLKIEDGTKVISLLNKNINPYVNNTIIEVRKNSSDSYFEARKSVKGYYGVIVIGDKILKDKNVLKIAIAHEIQHAIQEANHLNTGNDAQLLSAFSDEDAKALVKSIKEKLPKLFENKGNRTDEDIVNEFLYYGSGEIAAYGAEISDVIDFYPTVIKSNDNGTRTITLPWGDSYTTTKSVRNMWKNIGSLIETLVEPSDPRQLEFLSGVVELRNSWSNLNDSYKDLYQLNSKIQDLFNSYLIPSYREFADNEGDVDTFVNDVYDEVIDYITSAEKSFGLPNKHRYHIESFISDETWRKFDEQYENARKNNDEKEMRRLVKFAALANGFDTSTKLYHGTPSFGFTNFNTPEAFVTDSTSAASYYSGYEQLLEIGDRSYGARVEYVKETIYSLSDVIERFRNGTYPQIVNTITGEVINPKEIPTVDEIFNAIISYADNYRRGLIGAEFVTFHPVQMLITGEGYDESYALVLHKALVNDSLIGEKLLDTKLVESLVELLITNRPSEPGIYSFYGRRENQFVADAEGYHWNQLGVRNLPSDLQGLNTRYLGDVIKASGYDSLKIEGITDPYEKTNIYIFFNPNRDLKSADLVTYDDDGKVIPLSQRFKSDTPSGDFRRGLVLYEALSKIQLPESKKLVKHGASSIGDIRTLFYSTVQNTELCILGQKVFEAYDNRIKALHGEDLPIRFLDDESMRKMNDGSRLAGLYNAVPDENFGLNFNADYLSQLLNDENFEEVAHTILHEVIHAVTVLTIHEARENISDAAWTMFVNTGVPGPEFYALSEEHRAALTLVRIYENVKTMSDPRIKSYGLKNVDEFIAELSNPLFRQQLKKVSLWQSIVNAIKKLLGIQVENALDAATQALNVILESDVTQYKIRDLKEFVKKQGEVIKTRALEISDDSKSELPLDKPKKVTEPGTYSTEGQAHLYSKGQQYRKKVYKKDTKTYGNLAEYEGQQLAQDMYNFIALAGTGEYTDIDPHILRRVKNGTLTRNVILSYLYNVDIAESGETDVQKKTFDLINRCFFNNKYFDSFTELDSYINEKEPDYYALCALMRHAGMMEELLQIQDAVEFFDSFKQQMLDNPEYSKRFSEIAGRYTSRDIDRRNMRRLTLQHFDGSILMAGYLGGVSTMLSVAEWRVSKSMSQTVGKSKDGKSTLTLEQTVSENEPDYTQDDVNMTNEFVSTIGKDEELSAAIQKFYTEKINTELDAASSASARNKILTELGQEMVRMLNQASYYFERDQAKFEEMYEEYIPSTKSDQDVRIDAVASLIAEGKEFLELDEDERAILRAKKAKALEPILKKIVRPQGNVVNSIRSANNTIKNYIGPRQRKKFLEIHGDLFDEKLNVREELYKTVDENGKVHYLDLDVLTELKKQILVISKEARAGFYHNEVSLKARENLRRRMQNLINIMTRAKVTPKKDSSGKQVIKNINVVTYTISGSDVLFNTYKGNQMPQALQQMVKTQIDQTDKTRVQFLSNDSEQHYVMNLATFIDANAEMLNGLTQQDVTEIVEFFRTSDIAVDNDVIKWSVTSLLMKGYLLKANDEGNVAFSLTRDDIEFLENSMKAEVSKAGIVLNFWGQMVKDYKASRDLNKALLKICDLELSLEEENILLDAVETNDIEQIRLATEKVYKKLIPRYKNRKRTFWDRAIRWQRVALLSGPNTWLRNQISNVTLTGMNRISDFISKAIPTSESERKFKQYKIAGTQIDERYKTFIEERIVKSGLLELIGDGFTKYDFRTTKKGEKDVQTQLVNMISRSIANKLFDEHSASSKFTQNIQKMIAFVMSDQKSINRAMVRYLGKMMSEDKVDISNGISKEILGLVADAYTLAAFDYMHKPNIFSKLEQSAREYFYKKTGRNKTDFAFFMYKQVFPFAAASWNWFIDKLQYNPVTLVKGIADLVRLENTINRMDNARLKGQQVVSSRFAAYLAKRKISKGLIGSFTLALGIILVAVGKAGVDDEDDKLKIRIGDDYWLDVSDFYGTNGLLTGIAIAQAFVDNDGFNLTAFGDAFVNSLAVMFDDSVFSDLHSTFRRNQTFGEVLIEHFEDIPGMLIPNFVKVIGDLFPNRKPKYSKGMQGWLERFMVDSFAPLGNLLPYQVNPYTGEPEQVSKVGWLPSAVNKFLNVKISPFAVSDAERISNEVGVYKTNLSCNYTVDGKDIELSPSEIQSANEFYGKLNKKTLDDFINNKTKHVVEDEDGKRVELKFSKMTEKQKAAVIKRITSNNSGLAKVYILTSTGKYKYYASESEYRELRENGITKNVYRKNGKYEGFIEN